ncbi:MAG: hypothetical protein K9J30_07540 [Bacteroidales bacterium]|nr:hypothetical protein [Bacteroidales bacterium]
MKIKLRHIVTWLLLISWFAVITGFVSNSNARVICKEMSISISDSTNIRFVTTGEIRNMLKNSAFSIQGYPAEEILTRSLEQMLETNSYIENAEVYINVEGDLFVDIDQRKPLMRVMSVNETGYFIDHDGVVLPLSGGYTPNVMLVNGHIDFPLYTDGAGITRVDPDNDKELEYLTGFARMISGHPFWKNQIVQVYRSANGEFELIPRVGAHQIIFGSMGHYAEKLRNLEALYEQGFKRYGWNTYDKINLKYENQIICTKR